MLKKVLSSSDCACCKFCCSFRRQSLWETPVFDRDTKEKIEKIFPDSKFKTTDIQKNDCSKTNQNHTNNHSLENSTEQFYTIDLLPFYKTDDPEEEVRCPFLKDNEGCQLSDELKPFDCKIWPIRIIKSKDGVLSLALEPTCSAINKLNFEKFAEFINKELKEKILDYAENHSQIIKPASELESRFSNFKSL